MILRRAGHFPTIDPVAYDQSLRAAASCAEKSEDSTLPSCKLLQGCASCTSTHHAVVADGLNTIMTMRMPPVVASRLRATDASAISQATDAYK